MSSSLPLLDNSCTTATTVRHSSSPESLCISSSEQHTSLSNRAEDRVSDMEQSSIQEGSNQSSRQSNDQGREQDSSETREEGSNHRVSDAEQSDIQEGSDQGSSAPGRGRGSSRGRGRGSNQNRGRGNQGRGQGNNARQHSGQDGRQRNNEGNSSRNDDLWMWNSEIDSSTLSPLPTFVGSLPGAKGEAAGVRSQLECFLLFLSSKMYDEILMQSNLYADQQRMAKNDTSPWNPITKEELLAFIGVNLAMGVVQLPSADDYWSIDSILAHPWFRAVLTRFRFRQILRYYMWLITLRRCRDPILITTIYGR